MNFGDIEVAKFLIEHGADVNIKYDEEIHFYMMLVL